MRNGQYAVYDQDRYKALQDEFKLDKPDLDTVMELVDVETLNIKVENYGLKPKGKAPRAIRFTCPFVGATSCTYYLAETAGADGADPEEQEDLIRTAAAAHVVTAHI